MMNRQLALVMLGLGFVVACGGKKPAPEAPRADPRIAQLEQELAQTKEALTREKDAADSLRKSDADRTAAEKALQDKLAEAVGKAGEVTTADGAVKLELVDQILFAVGEADLTEQGREVLAKVGAALKDVDKQIWVQGHTDDQPIYVPKKADPKAAAAAKVDPKKKADPKAKAPPPGAKKKPGDASDAVLAFVTNWELSAARALTVVHYLQDDAKVDPTRLAAVAFGQYRPVSKTKAKNRRIEIVLYPRVAITPK
ncbi:MAG: OmpA family protein [Deltaproteobacteria bacterium]|nr:OmpA family protein [Deltaproteobacteria bacterium]MCW5806823.1 OmpA family protein [Deltaproteobacteria bacterium]